MCLSKLISIDVLFAEGLIYPKTTVLNDKGCTLVGNRPSKIAVCLRTYVNKLKDFQR